MPRHIDLTIDCHEPLRLAAFWRLALGYEDEPPPSPFRSREEWLAHLGVPPEEWGGGAWLHDPSGSGPRLTLLEVPEAKVARNRVHLDVKVSEGTGWAEVVRMSEALAQAGGAILAVYDAHHIVMADPEGNEFCIL